VAMSAISPLRVIDLWDQTFISGNWVLKARVLTAVPSVKVALYVDSNIWAGGS